MSGCNVIEVCGQDCQVIEVYTNVINVGGTSGGTGGGTVTTSEAAKSVKTSIVVDSVIGGNRAVIRTATGLALANNTDAGHSGLVIGITQNAASAGGTVEVVNEGELEGFSGLSVNSPIYLSTNGLLTQSLPASGFIQQVGMALTATKIFVHLFTPIHLI